MEQDLTKQLHGLKIENALRVCHPCPLCLSLSHPQEVLHSIVSPVGASVPAPHAG